MAYIYRDTVNIYDKEAIARAIKTQETQFNVLQGKIQALITDTELDTLRNGGSTMYSRMVNVEATANGLTSEVSSLRTNLQDNYSTTESMRSEIQQSADSITTSVSTAISGLNTRVQQAETKVTPTAIINTVASADGARAMVSAINQTASTVQISAAHINLIGAVTADCIATGAVTAEKIDVDDLFAQDITATGTISGVTISGGTISGGTITGGSISGGSINGATVTGGSISGATVTGGTISGTNCNIQEGSIGNWAIRNGALVDTSTGSYLTGTWVSDQTFRVESLWGNMFGETTTGQPTAGLVPNLRRSVGEIQTDIAGHETRISALENASPSYPENISCTSVTATGAISGNSVTATQGLSGDSLSVTHGITAVQIDLTGHVNAGNITGTDLYTQTSNAGTGSNAVITGTGRVAPTTASSKRYKDHISSVTLEQAMKVLDIPVINFKYKDGYLVKGDEMEGKAIPGFYAEDIESLIPIAVYHNKDGQVESWLERIMIPLMLKVIQEQQHEIEELKRR